MGTKAVTARLVFSLTLCFLAACTGSVSSTSPKKPLKVEWTLWQGDYTLLVANEKGYFKKYGLDVEPVEYNSATQAIPDMAGARLDGGLFTMADTILASNLTDVKSVMVSDNGGIYSIVASSDITSVKGLRGKRIGFNLHTASEMYVNTMLKSESMTLNDVSFVEMSPDKVPGSIPGQIDAGLVWEPYTTQAIQQGQHVLYQSTKFSTLTPKMLVFRSAVLEQRPDDIRSFILAWNEAVNYRITHPQEAIDIISKATDLPASELALTSDLTIFTIDDNLKLFADTNGTDASSIYYIAGFNRDFLINTGYITAPPDIDKMLDASFLK